MFAGRRPWDSEEAIQAMFKVCLQQLSMPSTSAMDVKLIVTNVTAARSRKISPTCA